MAYLSTEPQVLTSAAADVDEIRSRIASATAAAANPTSGVIAPAADEVSTAFSAALRQFGREYQVTVAHGGQLCGVFAQNLAAAGNAYLAAEADTEVLMGVAGNPTPAATAFDVAIVMGGSGLTLPDTTFMNGALNWATFGGFSVSEAEALATPEGFYPFTGVNSLTLTASVAQGVQILDSAIKMQIPTHTVLVQGYSQSSIIASLEMQNLLNPALNPTPPTGNQLGFNLLADPMNPNGGLLARFPGLNLPSLGIDFYGATPANTPWTTNIYSMEYDGWADFPRYPIDVVSDLNAFAGMLYVHGTYPSVDPSTLPTGDIVKLQTSSDYTGPLANTTYWMVQTPNLPLLDPLRAVPVIGNPLADLLQPDLKVIVNLGYGDPNYGYSTSPANVPTPFGLFPGVSQGVVAGALASGTQQGFSAFASDVMAPQTATSVVNVAQSLASMSPPALPSPAAVQAALSPASVVDGVIQAVWYANDFAATAVGGVLTVGYSTLLPTADFANAVLISIPAYDINLFLGGIGQALSGDPFGLVNAVGDPIAADVGLLTVTGGIEGLVLYSGVGEILEFLLGLL